MALSKKLTAEELADFRRFSLEMDEEVETTECCYCKSNNIRRCGRVYSGGIRYRCRNCSRSFSFSTREFYIKARMRFEPVITLFEQGYGIRHIARETGFNTHTVAKIRDTWCDRDQLKCGCGGRYGHRGWCSWRFKQSPKRQAVMDALHEKQRNQSVKAW